MNLLKYPRKITRITNIGYSLSLAGSIACVIKDPRAEWWLPLFVITSYVFMIWLIKKKVWDKRAAKEWGRKLAQEVFANLEYVKPFYVGRYLLCSRHPEQTKTPCPICYPYTVEELALIENKHRSDLQKRYPQKDEIHLQYLLEEYKPQNINFNCVCQTREQFELFSKFLLEFQRIGGKVI